MEVPILATLYNKINAFVDVMGSSYNQTFFGMCDVVNDINYKPNIIFHIGHEKDDIKDYSEKDKYIPKIVSGIITDNVNGNIVPLSNIRVSFIQEFESSKIVADYCMTDSNGKYNVFVKPGNYTIRIDSGSGSQVYPNQIIEEGLNNEINLLPGTGHFILEQQKRNIEFLTSC
jgi:hypothetical protein